MLPTTLADVADQVRHDVDTLERQRDKLVREHDEAVAKINTELAQKRAVLEEYEAFFEWQHQQEGGGASLKAAV